VNRSRAALLSVLVIAAAIALWRLPYSVPPHRLSSLIVVAVFALALVSLNLVLGYAGQLSLGQVGFMAIGGYSTAITTVRLDWHPLVGMIVGVGLSAGTALVLGLVVFRMRNLYFAIATLGFGLIVESAIQGFGSRTGGSSGIAGVPALEGGPFRVATQEHLFHLAAGLVVVALLYTRQLLRTREGMGMRAVAFDELTAGATGVGPLGLKLRVFIASAVLASVAGSLYVHHLSVAVPDLFNIGATIRLVVMGFLGGMGTLAGPAVGAATDLTRELYRGARQWTGVIEGAVLGGVILFMPDGLAGAAKRLWRRVGPLLSSSLFGPGRLHRSQEATGEEGPSTIRFPSRAGSAIEEAGPSGPAGRPILRVEGVTLAFGGVVAVNDVSFDIQRGAFVSVIGPNGAGKTTLSNLITGVAAPESGRIVFDERDVTGLPAHRRARMAMTRTFQIPRLLENTTVLENVLLGRYCHRRPGFLGALMPRTVAADYRRSLAAARAALESVHLADLADRRVSELPAGQVRLVDVARAVAAEPQMLVLDEPAGGLNAAERVELADCLRHLSRSGVTVCLIEHNMDLVMEVSDRILVMNFGRLIADGTPVEVRGNEAVIEAYLGSGSHVA
jgi:branched-chain amino acid transport system permease protein